MTQPSKQHGFSPPPPPHKVSEMKPVASDVDILGNFPSLKDVSILSSLKSELATYLSKAEDGGAMLNQIFPTGHL